MAGLCISQIHVQECRSPPPFPGAQAFVRVSFCLVKNIGTLSVQELFFQLIGLLGVRLDVSPVGMVELFVHGASLTT